MRAIERTSAFKKDLKRELKGLHRKTLEAELKVVLDLLTADAIMPARYEDHPLTGEWRGYRDCHVKPDLVLIYRKEGKDVLRLDRLGSHSELF